MIGLVYECAAGVHIGKAIDRAFDLAREARGVPVYVLFNGVMFLLTPDESPDEAYQRWHNRKGRSVFVEAP